jgi:hypothetical protein
VRVGVISHGGDVEVSKADRLFEIRKVLASPRNEPEGRQPVICRGTSQHGVVVKTRAPLLLHARYSASGNMQRRKEAFLVV